MLLSLGMSRSLDPYGEAASSWVLKLTGASPRRLSFALIVVPHVIQDGYWFTVEIGHTNGFWLSVLLLFALVVNVFLFAAWNVTSQETREAGSTLVMSPTLGFWRWFRWTWLIVVAIDLVALPGYHRPQDYLEIVSLSLCWVGSYVIYGDQQKGWPRRVVEAVRGWVASWTQAPSVGWAG